jgi:hypothetical protein
LDLPKEIEETVIAVEDQVSIIEEVDQVQNGHIQLTQTPLRDHLHIPAKHSSNSY